MSIYALDQDSNCSYKFYKEQKEVIDETCNRLGYYFIVTSAEGNDNQLLVTIKNTGLAPAFFNGDLCEDDRLDAFDHCMMKRELLKSNLKLFNSYT